MSKCAPKERLRVKKQPKPSHFVQFEDRLERMLDSEINKYKVSEGEYAMPAGELESAMFCLERCMNEPNELMLYLNIHMPKEIAEQGMSAKELVEGMKKKIQSLKDFKTYTWVKRSEADRS